MAGRDSGEARRLAGGAEVDGVPMARWCSPWCGGGDWSSRPWRQPRPLQELLSWRPPPPQLSDGRGSAAAPPLPQRRGSWAVRWGRRLYFPSSLGSSGTGPPPASRRRGEARLHPQAQELRGARRRWVPSHELLLPSLPAWIWRSRAPPARAQGGGRRPRGPCGGPLLPPLTVPTLPPCPLSSRQRLLHGTGEEGGYGRRPPRRAQLQRRQQTSTAADGGPPRRDDFHLCARGSYSWVLHGAYRTTEKPLHLTLSEEKRVVALASQYPGAGEKAKTQRHRANLSRSVPIAHTGTDSLS
jgi:hypothetical protein